MVRDSDALKIEKWAANGDVQTPEDGGLDRSTGWDATYSQPGGNVPKREHLNQILRELSAQGVEVNVHGLLGWDPSISYQHPALVMGSDAKPYLSVADSLGVDPTTDTTESSWVLYQVQGAPGPPGADGSDADVPLASTAVAGKVELATQSDGENDGVRAVTRLLLKQLGYLTLADVPLASTSAAGKVELATQSDGENDGVRAVTRLLLKQLGYLTLAEAEQRFVTILRFTSSVSDTSRNATTVYSVTLPSASGGTSPYTYSVTYSVTAGTYSLTMNGRTFSLTLPGQYRSPSSAYDIIASTYQATFTAQVADSAGAIASMTWVVTVREQHRDFDDDDDDNDD